MSSPMSFSRKKLGVRRAQEIRDRLTRWMDLWERGLHEGLVGDTKGRAASGEEEEDEAVAQS